MIIEFLQTTETIIPIWQIMLLLLLSTGALLFGRVKLALIINYIFTLNWGYISNQDYIFENVEHAANITTVYFGLGVLIAILAAAGFLLQKG